MCQAEGQEHLGIIGGSGLRSLSILESGIDLPLETPFGKPSAEIRRGVIGTKLAFFLARHGPGNSIAPHFINYRANIWAMKHLGVMRVVSVASVGGIQNRFSPGTLVVPDQIVDYTWGRPSTFRADGEAVTHIDFTQPFSSGLRTALLGAAERCGQRVVNGGVYAATQGPRLETAAEINRIERDGGNIVGMTGMPEAALARELALDYAMIAVVVNHAAGRGTSKEVIRHSDMAAETERALSKVELIFKAFASQ